jgi:hypothetical protein
MRGVAAVFMHAGDALAARVALEALQPPPATVADGRLGAAGEADDDAILLAIHIEDDRVEVVRMVVAEYGGRVIAVVRISGP